MSGIPKIYQKTEFIKLLRKKGESEDLIEKINQLPLSINYENDHYKLNLIYNDLNGQYEMNYYCENTINFLFTYKIFSDVEKAYNHLECWLANKEIA